MESLLGRMTQICLWVIPARQQPLTLHDLLDPQKLISTGRTWSLQTSSCRLLIYTPLWSFLPGLPLPGSQPSCWALELTKTWPLLFPSTTAPDCGLPCSFPFPTHRGVPFQKAKVAKDLAADEHSASMTTDSQW